MIEKSGDWIMVQAMKSFREAFVAHLEQTGEKISDIAEAKGVSAQQLYKVKQGKSDSTNVEDAQKVASYFGMTLDDFLGSDPSTTPHRLTLLYSRLSDQKRQRLEGYAEALDQEPDN